MHVCVPGRLPVCVSVSAHRARLSTCTHVCTEWGPCAGVCVNPLCAHVLTCTSTCVCLQVRAGTCVCAYGMHTERVCVSVHECRGPWLGALLDAWAWPHLAPHGLLCRVLGAGPHGRGRCHLPRAAPSEAPTDLV